MADKIEVSPTMIQKYFFHGSDPEDDVKERIIKATLGFITREDFEEEGSTRLESLKSQRALIEKTLEQATPVFKLVVISEVQIAINDGISELQNHVDKSIYNIYEINKANACSIRELITRMDKIEKIIEVKNARAK